MPHNPMVTGLTINESNRLIEKAEVLDFEIEMWTEGLGSRPRQNKVLPVESAHLLTISVSFVRRGLGAFSSKKSKNTSRSRFPSLST